MYDRGWWQKSARTLWHHFDGVTSSCGRHQLPGTPTGGYSAAPYGPGRVCRECLQQWKSPALWPARARAAR